MAATIIKVNAISSPMCSCSAYGIRAGVYNLFVNFIRFLWCA